MFNLTTNQLDTIYVSTMLLSAWFIFPVTGCLTLITLTGYDNINILPISMTIGLLFAALSTIFRD